MTGTSSGRVPRARERLRAAGARLTTPRLAVLAALDAADGHPTAEELVAAVAQREPEVHRASVYRALESLSEHGVVRHVHVGHHATVYHLVDEPAVTHLHASCRGCQALIDLPDGVLDAVRDRLERELGFRLDAGHVALSGLCAQCARTGKAPADLI